MADTATAIAVTMNNYFHDLSVGFMWASSIMAHLVLRYWPKPYPERLTWLLKRIAWGSFAWVMVGGAVRLYFYKEYEWLPEAGFAQVPALAVKHVLLVGLTVWGLIGVVRLDRELRRHGEAPRAGS